MVAVLSEWLVIVWLPIPHGFRWFGKALSYGQPPSFLVHCRSCSLANHQGISPSLQFLEKVAEVGSRSWVAIGNAALVIGGTMLSEMLVCGAAHAVNVGRHFGKQCEAILVARAFPPEDDDGRFAHGYVPCSASLAIACTLRFSWWLY
jgi:hypothetical protein